MKSVKVNLEKQEKRDTDELKGSYILLAEAIKNKKFSRFSILKNFNEFVLKEEFDISDKNKLITELYNLSNPK